MQYLSPADQLRTRAEELKARIKALGEMASVTDLYERDRQQELEDRRWGQESGVVVLHVQPFVWNPLLPDGQKAQQALHEQYGRLRAFVRVLLRDRVSRVIEEFKEADQNVSQFITHERSNSKVVGKEVASVVEAVDKLVSLVVAGEDTSDRRTVLVPDTNALIFNPQIEAWKFDDFTTFRLVIMPTVLHELDQLKVIGRTEGLRDKAERVIRQLKEYRRRGPLHEGVTIRAGVSELVTVAVEPDMNDSLPWLKESNADDRLIASTVEMMRLYPHSPLALVTRDINAQNKAAFAGIPLAEPPDPVLPTPT